MRVGSEKYDVLRLTKFYRIFACFLTMITKMRIIVEAIQPNKPPPSRQKSRGVDKIKLEPYLEAY